MGSVLILRCRDTILRLLVLVGERCQRLTEKKIVNIPVDDVEVDWIWGYVYKKEGHKWEHERNREDIEDAYCLWRWSAVPSWLLLITLVSVQSNR